MLRRSFLATATAMAAPAAEIARRKAKVEIVFDSPGRQPNGMQATSEGLWMLDQGDNKVYLVSPKDGSVIRSMQTECDKGSGMTFDGEALWLNSTYNCRILKVDAQTGKTLGNYPCPGTGPVKWSNPRKSARAPGGKAPAANAAAPPKPDPVSGLTRPTAITGGHGMEYRDGKLWAAVPPAPMIYRIVPKTFMVDFMFPTPGDRPHGLGWDGKYLWLADTNQNAFHKLDPETGKAVEMIQLTDNDPPPHGMTIWQGTMWWCDADSRAVCRLKLA